jgi:hypothetical protein
MIFFRCRKFIFFLIIASMAILLSCGTGPANISENFSLFETDSERARPSEEKIDQGKTYEIYFRLNRPEPCIHVTMTASYLPYRFAKQEKASTVYFVVERLIDISSFRKNEKSVYSSSAEISTMNGPRTRK